MPTPAETTGLILAGGRSRRYGSDKALAHAGGVPFVRLVHDALAAHAAEVIVATGPTARVYPVPARPVLDRVADGGPLAGLAAGLAAARTPWLLAVAVDLPALTADALAPLLAADAAAVDADVVVALDGDGRRQPVCALWRVDAVRPVAEAHLAWGRLALFALLGALRVAEVALDAGALRNVNAPP